MRISYVIVIVLFAEHVVEGDQIDEDPTPEHERKGGVPIFAQAQKA